MARKAVKGEVATVEKKTIYGAFDAFIVQCEREKDKKTVAKFRSLRAHLSAFNPDLDFQDLDFNFYDAFKEHLYAVPNPNYPGCVLIFDTDGLYYDIVPGSNGEPVGLFDETVFKYFVNLKTFLEWAKKRGHNVHQSFESWEIIVRKHTPISLTLAELEKVEAFEITPDIILKHRPTKKGFLAEKEVRNMKAAQDYLIAECRTGARVSDLKRFSLQDVKDMVWTYSPKKGSRLSNKKVSLPFIGFSLPAWSIFQRNGWKMPVISEQKLNNNIKRLCQMAGITQELSIFRWQGSKRIRITGPKYEFISTHTGRKTCVTLLINEFGMPTELVMDSVGISSYSTLQHYKGDSDVDQRKAYLEKYKNQSTLRKAL
jgi:integrase